MITRYLATPSVGTILFLVLLTAVRWFLTPVKTTVLLPDLLFVHSAIAFIVGLVIYLSNTVRTHYYRHLMSRFSGKVLDDIEYEQAEEKRKMYALWGKKIAWISIGGIGVSAGFAFV